MSKPEEMALTTSEPRPRITSPERHITITPLDMRQARFSTALRGFDKDDVTTFLKSGFQVATKAKPAAKQRTNQPGSQHATPAKSNKKKHTKHHRKSAAAKPSALKNSTPNSPAAK